MAALTASLSRLSLSTEVGGGVSCEVGAVRGILDASGKKASQALGKTVCELQATLSSLEKEISTVEEVSGLSSSVEVAFVGFS